MSSDTIMIIASARLRCAHVKLRKFTISSLFIIEAAVNLASNFVDLYHVHRDRRDIILYTKIRGDLRNP